MNKVISFTDQSESFTYGVEFGRILEKIERGDINISNNGFPIRLENKKLIEVACEKFNYIPLFGKEHYDEWIEFTGIKKTTNNN
tara:strand:- start:185 stop:436 length:252 start_codon:yes stop_codon:yes gene_type:complete